MRETNWTAIVVRHPRANRPHPRLRQYSVSPPAYISFKKPPGTRKGQGGIGNEAGCETTPGESDRGTRILPAPQTNTTQQPATLGAPAGRPVVVTIPARRSFRRE